MASRDEYHTLSARLPTNVSSRLEAAVHHQSASLVKRHNICSIIAVSNGCIRLHRIYSVGIGYDARKRVSLRASVRCTNPAGSRLSEGVVSLTRAVQRSGVLGLIG